MLNWFQTTKPNRIVEFSIVRLFLIVFFFGSFSLALFFEFTLLPKETLQIHSIDILGFLVTSHKMNTATPPTGTNSL